MEVHNLLCDLRSREGGEGGEGAWSGRRRSPSAAAAARSTHRRRAAPTSRKQGPPPHRPRRHVHKGDVVVCTLHLLSKMPGPGLHQLALGAPRDGGGAPRRRLVVAEGVEAAKAPHGCAEGGEGSAEGKQA